MNFIIFLWDGISFMHMGLVLKPISLNLNPFKNLAGQIWAVEICANYTKVIFSGSSWEFYVRNSRISRSKGTTRVSWDAHTLVTRDSHHLPLCVYVLLWVGVSVVWFSRWWQRWARSGCLNGVLPLLLYRCSPGGADIPRSVPVSDQDGYGMETSRSLIFIYFFVNCFTEHSRLSLLFKLYRSSSNIPPWS